MTRIQSSAITIAFAALLAGPAMAANTDAPVTREQVKTELAEAKRTGNIAYGESDARMNELYLHNYPTQQNVTSKTRDQVKTELAEALSKGLLDIHMGA